MHQGLLHNGPPLPALTVGQRNNNYGNLRSNDPFVGKTGSNGYDIYDTPENGLRALARTLHTYGTKRGVKSISDLVDRYAPAGDNSTASRANYKQLLANSLGVGVDDEIDIAAQRLPLMRGIIQFENGRQLASDDMIEAAIAAADGTDKVTQMAQMYIGEDDPNRTIGGQIISPAEEQRRLIEEAVRAKRIRDERMRANAPTMNLSAYPPGFTMASPPPAQPAPMAMPSEDDANQNIDGSQVNQDALLYTIPQTVGGLFRAGQNARPDGPPPNPVLNSQAYSPDAVLNQVMGNPNAPAPAGPTPLNARPAYQMMPPPAKEVDANPQTNQRRNQSAMSFDPGIDFNEQLIRIGLAGVGASGQGGLAALGAMGDMYGALQDANRSNALAAYEASLKGNKDKSGMSDDDLAYLDRIDGTLFTMDEALGFLNRAKSGEGGGLTGFLDGTIGAGWDRMMGNPEAMGRRLLEQLRVDDALLRVAQTKGAISNHEMRLFLSPAPTKFDDEQVWIDWINQRRRAALRIKDRLTNGRKVDPSEAATKAQVDEYGQQGGGNSAEIDALVQQYS